MKLFAMEKELRIIKNRGHFPVLLITPQGIKIETLQDKKKVLDAVDTEITEMIKAVRESEENYEREQEEAKSRDHQLRLTRQTNRCKPQHMHIPHDSSSEGQRTKHGDTVHHHKLQSP